jgi:hypothetical protein
LRVWEKHCSGEPDERFLSALGTRKYIAEITDGLILALQRRGLARTDYTHAYFRDNLLEF